MYIPNSCPAADTGPGTQAGFAAAQQRASNAAIEVDAPWSSLRCLTPDATQLADVDWQPQAPPGLVGAIRSDSMPSTLSSLVCEHPKAFAATSVCWTAYRKPAAPSMASTGTCSAAEVLTQYDCCDRLGGGAVAQRSGQRRCWRHRSAAAADDGRRPQPQRRPRQVQRRSVYADAVAMRPRAGNVIRAPQAEPRTLCHYRVPVASQDPIVAITCVLHSSGDAAMAAPAEGQAGLLRDDDGLDDEEDVS